MSVSIVVHIINSYHNENVPFNISCQPLMRLLVGISHSHILDWYSNRLTTSIS
jgi:hypothetical protein